jgi:formate dehydrogenase subunit delta
MSPEKMVMMANQIASFFNSQPGDPAARIAAHLRDYWEPRMRAQLRSYVEDGGRDLDPNVMAAARLL